MSEASTRAPALIMGLWGLSAVEEEEEEEEGDRERERAGDIIFAS